MTDIPKKILVVDDEASVRTLLRRCFEMEAFEVVEADCGADMMAALDAGGVDLITLDLKLGGEDRLQLAREVRSRFTTPIIMVSGKSELVFLSYGIDAANFGFSNYAEIDVKGKFVVVLPGTPKFDEDTPVNLAGISQQASNKYKVDAAKKNGAAGIIFVPGELELSYWERFKKYSTICSRR